MDEQGLKAGVDGFVKYLDSISNVLNHSSISKPKKIYHYTSEIGAFGILSERRIRATNINFLNDKSEYFHAIEVANEILFERVKSNQRVRSELASNVIRKFSESKFPDVYVSSFSLNEDQLSQWRAYTKPGGYCIGFDFENLNKKKKDQSISIHKCIYNRRKQRELIENIVDSFLNLPVYKSKKRSETEKRFESLAEHFVDFFSMVAPIFKNPSFDEESEYRLIRSIREEISNIEILFNPTRSLLIPYINIDLGEDTIFSNVICGPNSDMVLAHHSMSLFKKQKKYRFMISNSEVPYRGT